MSKLQVYKGYKILVSVKLELEGTVYNKIITVEDQYIPITDGTTETEFEIALDGDPITIIGRFRGEPALSKVKVFEVSINGFVAKNNDLIIKTGELEIKHQVPFAFFDLIESPKPNQLDHEIA